VNLSRLLGANKRYIEQSIPHIGSLMVESAEEAVDHAEIVIVGHGTKHLQPVISGRVRKEQQVIDLAGVPRAELAASDYAGACW
jgi:GDP-mannose 6-dehydrogenase